MSFKSSNGVNLEDILTDKVVEEDFLEVPLRDTVFKAFFIVSSMLVFLFIVQVVRIGILHKSFYSSRALANARYAKTEMAPRGVIVDRFGNTLVHNESSLSVFLIPHELPKTLDEQLIVFRKVSEVLGIDREELYREIEEKDWGISEKLFLMSDLNHDQIAILESADMGGVSIESGFRRIHEVPRTFSHVMGFTGFVDVYDLEQNPNLFIDDKIGKAGLEYYYDKYLRGVRGEEVFLRDAVGELIEKESSELPKPGDRLETFLDLEFQKYFYDRLVQGLTGLGKNTGVGIALNPQNGEVLALFSIPGFDVSEVAASLDRDDQPFFNRVVSGLYSPGSTIKPLVATAALVEGVVGPETQIFSQGFIEVPNPYDPNNPSRFLDWKPHGWVNLRDAIAKSSNVYFYGVGGGLPAGMQGFKDQPGLGLGIKRLREWWQKFNLEDITAIDVPGEYAGFLPSPSWKEKEKKEPWRLGDTYNVSIGQGDLLVTPISLLNYISAVANGGVFYQPRVMKSIVNGEGVVVMESQPTVLKDIREDVEDHIEEVQRGMRDAVAKPYGTAYFLNDVPGGVSAKTGTAQVAHNKKLNAFFVGYAPYENPEIAILVLVEDALEGSLNAVPVARDVLLWYYENRIKDKS